MCAHAHTHQPKRTAKKTQNSLNAFKAGSKAKEEKLVSKVDSNKFCAYG